MLLTPAILLLAAATIGGYTKLDLGKMQADPTFTTIVNYGVAQISTIPGFEGQTWELVDVVSAETQVVNGMNYKLVVNAENTSDGFSENFLMVVNYVASTNSMSIVSIYPYLQ